MFGDELPCQMNGRFAPFESYNLSTRPDPFRKQIENPLRSAADVNRSVTGSNVELIEKAS
jgi:hypothetical protein